MKIRAIITGVTGMVGEGVLLECLANNNVEAVLTLVRKPSGKQHPKLKEIVLTDFMNIDSVEYQLYNYNACYFCAGVSSVGMKEPEYTAITYGVTMKVAETLSKINPDMTFCYVSGASTDSTEKGNVMWARVKGKTENDLMKLSFKQVFAFRPAFMKPTDGQQYVLPAYKYVGWLYKPVKALFPNIASTIAEVGQAMINVTSKGFEKKILEVKDILEAAKR
jgi:hypothetical protein